MVNSIRYVVKHIIFKSLLICVMIISMCISMFTSTCYISYADEDTNIVGKYIKFGNYLGEPIIWRVIHKVTEEDVENNIYKGYKEGELFLLSDRIICFKCFDGSDSKQNDDKRNKWGNNEWSSSNIRIWLNSKESIMNNDSYGGTGVAPNNSNVNYNPYETEAGFLSDVNFTKKERNMIQEVTNRYVIDFDLDGKDGGEGKHEYKQESPESVIKGYNTAAYKNSLDKVFFLNIDELYNYVYNKLNHVNGKPYYIACSTSKAREKNGYESPTRQDEEWMYWLRDENTIKSCSPRLVLSGGSIADGGAFSGFYGVRPALYLDMHDMCLDNNSGDSPSTAYGLIEDTIKPNGKFYPESSNQPKDIKKVEFKPSDNSGVDRWKYSISTDGGKTYGEETVVMGSSLTEIVLDNEGKNKIKIVVYDFAGNFETLYSGIYIIKDAIPIELNFFDKKNFKYYLGKNRYGKIKVMLVSKTGEDLKFTKYDILETSGEKEGYFKKGIIYINEQGKFKRYK